jgi:hypothetical protein
MDISTLHQLASTPVVSSEKYTIIIHQYEPATELQAYCRFSGIPFTVINSAYPRYASYGDLPYIQHGSNFIGADRALDYLKRIQDIDLTTLGSSKVRAQTETAMAMVRTTLQYITINSKLHSHIHIVANGTIMPTPLAWFIPRGIRQSQTLLLYSLGYMNEAWLHHQTIVAYRTLATLLTSSSGPYFGGEHPCSLDAAIYGHLESIRHTQISKWLHDIAPALIEYYSYIRKTYFTTNSSTSSFIVFACDTVHSRDCSGFVRLFT